MKKFIAAFAALFLSSPLAFAEHGMVNAPWVCRASEPEFVKDFLDAYQEADGNFDNFVPFLMDHDMIINPGAECVIIQQAFGRESVPIRIQHVFEELDTMQAGNVELLPVFAVIESEAGDLPVIVTMGVDVIEDVLSDHPAPGEGA